MESPADAQPPAWQASLTEDGTACHSHPRDNSPGLQLTEQTSGTISSAPRAPVAACTIDCASLSLSPSLSLIPTPHHFPTQFLSFLCSFFSFLFYTLPLTDMAHHFVYFLPSPLLYILSPLPAPTLLLALPLFALKST